MAWYRSTNYYSSTLHTESHMSQTGRLYGFVRVPPQINLFKFPGDVLDEPCSHFPPIMAYGSPTKAEGFFPMEPWNSDCDRIHYSDDDYSPDYGMGSPGAEWKPLFEHPQYSASVPSPPRKDMHYVTASNRPIWSGPPRSKPEIDTDYYAMESPKARQQASFVPTTGKHPDYYAPDATPPKKDPYYGTTNNRPIVPSPLQSKPESYYGTKNNSRPSHDSIGKGVTRENQETIDSREARKRYGGKSRNQPLVEEDHVETIDCREAARKYNGIFVP